MATQTITRLYDSHADAVDVVQQLEAASVPSEAARVNAVLDGRAPVNLATRRTEYEAEGWKSYDPDAAPYTAEQVTTERKRRVVSVR